jgi:hypothetical protein
MALGFNPKFKASDITKQIKQQVKKIEAAILNRLQFIGETFIKNARENGTYKDQTGNLRSSIGYMILKDGQQVSIAFPGTKVQGRSRGEAIAEEVAGRQPKGFVLIVVAGMDYAAAVESKNYDVLTASSITAENDLKKAISTLKAKIA